MDVKIFPILFFLESLNAFQDNAGRKLLEFFGTFAYFHVTPLNASRNIYRHQILTLRRLMSYIYIYIYIYGAPILDVSRSHTTTQHSR